MLNLICCHGKEGSPTGVKILLMAEVAKQFGIETIAQDFKGINDPEERVRLLMKLKPNEETIIAGSSMGGYVALAVANEVEVAGLFLLAPAINCEGYAVQSFAPKTENVTIIHGVEDAVIPFSKSVEFAASHNAKLFLTHSDHRLETNLSELEAVFGLFLKATSASAARALGAWF